MSYKKTDGKVTTKFVFATSTFNLTTCHTMDLVEKYTEYSY